MFDDMSERFAYIEARLLWEDGLTARELAAAFGLARQTAQGVLDAYRRAHPEAFAYNPSLKRQIATERFEPHYIRPDAGSFLEYLRGEGLISHFHERDDWVETPMTDVSRLIRPRLAHAPVRAILAGMRQQSAVTMNYQSKRESGSREFSPHTLIYASNRYHVRGFCHFKEAFLDFVLSRVQHAEPSETPWISNREDEAWHNFVPLRFHVNPQLPPEAARAAGSDYGVAPDGELVIRCRRALAFYVERDLQVLDSRFKIPRWLAVD